ncbi:hypothetical protein CBI30_06940 [Polynucleobacter aenigmaticus]|uniref:Uncharacterized protein n=1 Tax=Polynucleobacter aenigmaticus TaxID=1743164 RepID=A0A254PY03_9BURK|nr:hypothetical protein [Polynucleobacter aenigmaticus]OWS71470.1 hypothetical protein CBI30_06940 [Polynucleobacter aenigmaticus]
MTVQKELVQVTGNRPKCAEKLVIKTTLLHANEQAAFKQLLKHPSLRLNELSEASMALVLRRALTLLTVHHAAIGNNQEKIEIERDCLFRLSRSGSAYRSSGYRK